MNSTAKNSRRPVNAEQEEKSQTRKGMISTPARNISDISRKLISMPYVGGVASVVAPVSSAVAQIAETFGYNKPVNLAIAEPRKLNMVENLSSGAGMDGTQRLSLYPDAKVVSHDTDIDGCDYALFENYKLLPGLVGLFTQNHHDQIGHEIASWPVTPCYGARTTAGGGRRYYVNHSQNLVCRHMYWRGSMKYKLIAFTQPFVSTRIRVTWFPNLAHSDPSITDFGGNYYSQVHDISGTTVIDVTIPYLSDQKYKMSCAPDVPRMANDQQQHLFLNGVVKLSVVNAIASPTETVTVGYALFQSCGEDLLVFNPQNFAAPALTFTSGQDSLYKPMASEDLMDVRKSFVKTFTPIHDSVFHVEGHVNMTEVSSDWRTYWHRYANMSCRPEQELVSEIRSNIGEAKQWLEIQINPSMKTVTRLVNAPDHPKYAVDLDFTGFNEFFQFRRGSMRYIAYDDSKEFLDAQVTWARPWQAPTSQIAPNRAVYGGLGTRQGGIRQDFTVRPALEFEIPYNNTANYWCTSNFKRDLMVDPVVSVFLSYDPGRGVPSLTGRTPMAMSVGDDYTWVKPRAPSWFFVQSEAAKETAWIGSPKEEQDFVHVPMAGDEIDDTLLGIEVSRPQDEQQLTELADNLEPVEVVHDPGRSNLWIQPNFEKAEISSILSRWYNYSVKWSSNMVEDTYVWGASFPEFLIDSQPFIRDKIRNFLYVRGHFEVQFRINATKMHAGALMASWLPHYSNREVAYSQGTTTSMRTDNAYPSGANIRPYPGVDHSTPFANLWNMSLNDFAIIDATTNTPLTVSISGATPLEMYNIGHHGSTGSDSVAGWFGGISLLVLNPLRNMDATQTDVDITVAIRWKDVELYGPTTWFAVPTSSAEEGKL